MMTEAQADVTCFPTKKDTPEKVNKLGKCTQQEIKV